MSHVFTTREAAEQVASLDGTYMDGDETGEANGWIRALVATPEHAVVQQVVMTLVDDELLRTQFKITIERTSTP